jgi:hypothetical protein
MFTWSAMLMSRKPLMLWRFLRQQASMITVLQGQGWQERLMRFMPGPATQTQEAFQFQADTPDICKNCHNF